MKIRVPIYLTFSSDGDGLMDKVSASQPRDRGFELHKGHDHDSSYDTSTCWFQEADFRVINLSCDNLLHN